MTINKEVKKLTLVFQSVKDAQNKGEEIDGIFGSLEVGTGKKPEDFKKINFIARLSESSAFEKHIKRMIKDALGLEAQEIEKKK